MSISVGKGINYFTHYQMLFIKPPQEQKKRAFITLLYIIIIIFAE